MKQTNRSGQIVILLTFFLTGLVFLFILCTDVFLAVRNKTRLRNAGDAAALAAARWQGVSLNLIGDLNLCRLAAACAGQTNAVADIVALQERLALAGPLVGFLAANETARHNGAMPDPEMTALVRTVQETAVTRVSPTWPTKGPDYAAMLEAVLSGGIAAGADNARLLPAVTGNHPLYSRSFYQAVEAEYNYRYICLNLFGGDHATAAATLQRWSGWNNIPDATLSNNVLNSEFFSLGLTYGTFPAGAEVNPAIVQPIIDLAQTAQLNATVTPDALRDQNVLTDTRHPWFFFDPSVWRTWHELARDGETAFPLLGSVKSELNLSGAMAACRVKDLLVPLASVDVTNAFTWTAAARPFGSRNGQRVTEVIPEVPLVLPLFSFVRLIPLGGVGDGNLHAADKAWVDHLRFHVPDGIRPADCRFCVLLDIWDVKAREVGEILANTPHDELCRPVTTPGGPGGGTSHAH